MKGATQEGRAEPDLGRVGEFGQASVSLLVSSDSDAADWAANPLITGSTGRERIYDNYPDIALDMVANRTFGGRLQLLQYVPTVLTGPPGAHPAS